MEFPKVAAILASRQPPDFGADVFHFQSIRIPMHIDFVIAYRTRLGILILATLITKLSYPSTAGSKIA